MNTKTGFDLYVIHNKKNECITVEKVVEKKYIIHFLKQKIQIPFFSDEDLDGPSFGLSLSDVCDFRAIQ